MDLPFGPRTLADVPIWGGHGPFHKVIASILRLGATQMSCMSCMSVYFVAFRILLY